MRLENVGLMARWVGGSEIFIPLATAPLAQFFRILPAPPWHPILEAQAMKPQAFARKLPGGLWKIWAPSSAVSARDAVLAAPPRESFLATSVPRLHIVLR